MTELSRRELAQRDCAYGADMAQSAVFSRFKLGCKSRQIRVEHKVLIHAEHDFSFSRQMRQLGRFRDGHTERLFDQRWQSGVQGFGGDGLVMLRRYQDMHAIDGASGNCIGQRYERTGSARLLRKPLGRVEVRVDDGCDRQALRQLDGVEMRGGDKPRSDQSDAGLRHEVPSTALEGRLVAKANRSCRKIAARRELANKAA